jgi:hypothetical protein
LVVTSDVIIFFFPFSLYYQVFRRASFSLVSLMMRDIFCPLFFFEMRLMRIFSAAEEKETKREKKEEGILMVHFSLKKAN